MDQGYKDAAAVVAGRVLEEHLRELCRKNGIATVVAGKPKKADGMNSELAGAGVYIVTRAKGGGQLARDPK